MGYVKSGFILSINRNENMGIVRENETGTEFIFFLDDLHRWQTMDIRINNYVTFVHDTTLPQFVATDIKSVYGVKKAV